MDFRFPFAGASFTAVATGCLATVAVATGCLATVVTGFCSFLAVAGLCVAVGGLGAFSGAFSCCTTSFVLAWVSVAGLCVAVVGLGAFSGAFSCCTTSFVLAWVSVDFRFPFVGTSFEVVVAGFLAAVVTAFCTFLADAGLWVAVVGLGATSGACFCGGSSFALV